MDFGSFRLVGSTADLDDEPAARPTADALEFRLDLAESPLEELAAYGGELPLLVTNRVRSEGGAAPDAPRRLDVLETAVEQPAVEAVDIELVTLEAGDGGRVVDAARDTAATVVVSAHDFDGTPPADAMAQTLRAAARAGDVGKLAVTATDPGDVLDLLAVTWSLASDGLPVATMAMGDAGRHSRAVAPLYGSRIGYAPVDPGNATAPGQYDLETLHRLVAALGGVADRDAGPEKG